MSRSALSPAVTRDGVSNVYLVLGAPIGVRTNSTDLATEVHELLQPFAVPPTDVPAEFVYSVIGCKGGRHEIYRGRELIATSVALHEALGYLLAAVNHDALDRFAGFAVHASVVARGWGAIAFPGASGAGKSTIAAASLLVGFDYVSDEALCVNPQSGAITPYPMPLRLSAVSQRLIALNPDPARDWDVLVTAGDLGAPVAAGAIRLAHCVQLVRRPGPPELIELRPAQTTSTLLRFSFNHYRDPVANFLLASDLGSVAHAWRLAYDDAASAAQLLARRFT